MEGSGHSEEGSREMGVEGSGEGSSRLRSVRMRKPRSSFTIWADKAVPSRDHTSNEAEAEGSGEMRHQNIDTVDPREVGGARWRRLTNSEANVSSWRGLTDNKLSETRDAADGTMLEGRNAGTDEGIEVAEVSGWRNPRVDRRHAGRARWERNPRASSAVTESSERDRGGRFADLFDTRARGSEASGSGDIDAHDHSSVIAFSSDEENGLVTGKKPVHDVIDLAGDSPLHGTARANGFINGEGPSHSSGASPLRRSMQRPAAGDAKRARRILHRNGVAYPEEPTEEVASLLPSEETHETTVPSGEQIHVARSLVQPYNLRRGRSLNLGASTLSSRLDSPSLAANNGLRRRLGRHRFQPSVGSGFGFADMNSLRRPFAVPSDTGNDSADSQLNRVVNLEDPDSATVVSVRRGSTIVLEDDGESERARQLAEDERVARELQDSFALEGLGGAPPPTDEMLARMLQDEENAHGRGLPLEQRPVFFAPSGMQALLGGEEDQREARRLFRNELAQGHAGVSDNAASSSRIARRGFGRNYALSRMLNAQSAPVPGNMNDRRVQFPASMGLESRMEFLAALEMAFQEQLPVGLQLAHVDRDFNENDYEMLLALDTDNDRHRGASWESISQLPVTTVAPTDVIEEDCSICLEAPVTGDIIRRLPCMHVFHQQCIDQWLQCQAVCPVCKAHI